MAIASLFLVVFFSRTMAATLSSRGPLSLPETNPDKDVPRYSQSVHVNVSASYGCVGEGRCRPCSRLEMTRQVQECLQTGYRQLAYCPHNKARKYVSCHYVVDSGKQRTFWLFEAMALVVGSLSLVVVYWRQVKIERTMAQRIEKQIRA